VDETPLRRPSIQRISSPAERPSGYTHTPVMAVSSISDRQAAPTSEQPAVVTEERLKLFARVIDYNDAGDVDDTENIVIGKLLALGFQIDIDYSQQQSRNACGVVAAAAAARLRLPDWQTADVAFAAAPCTIQRALQHMQPWWPSPLEVVH
jgi:hypothetical protein